ncbi:MAG: hypothetical protein GWP06_09905 [Actinobacteria bacterium]|nr:hypothetical protein [Actinomycetota bacterium]
MPCFSQLQKHHNIPVIITFFIIFFFLSNTRAQDIYINEFLASNSSINQDPDFNEYSDWLELFNAGEQDATLDGFYLTDDLDDSTKWRIPNGTTIQAGGFLLIWADKNDSSLNALHTNFNLKKSGEQIGLFAPDGSVIDSLSYDGQTTDISYGRKPDGSAEWFFFEQPTPGETNGGELFSKAEPPQFSISGGFYSKSQMLEISTANPAAVIHYTLDCSDPTATSPAYTGQIPLTSRSGDANYFSEIRTTADPEPWLPDWVPPAGEVFKATVVRARAFQDGKTPSDIITQTYFIDPNIASRYPTIAVISLVSDYKNLFDDATGIYVPGNTHRSGSTRSGNYFQGWEKPAHIEFFESGGEREFSQDVGIKIQGGTSQASAQKGLHVIARSEYGSNRIKYPIFKNTRFKARDIKEYKRFIIRAWGSTINAALFNDAYAQSLMADTDLDINAYRPVVLFIDGEYWGLHELREANKNSWYYQYHYNIDRDNPGFDILEHTDRSGKPYAAVDEGDATHWNAMVQFLQTHDMSLAENYDYIKTQMDVDNFIEYIGHCVYLVKWDWPNNNEASWRPKTPDGKWRWTQYDMETSFGVAAALNPIYKSLGASFNMIRDVIYGTPIIGFGQFGPHPVLDRLLENNEFKNAFAKWFYDNMKTRFSPENMSALLDTMAAEIEPYLPEYRQRWPFVTDMNNDWHYHLNLIKDFAQKRPDYVKQHWAARIWAVSYGQTGVDLPARR